MVLMLLNARNGTKKMPDIRLGALQGLVYLSRLDKVSIRNGVISRIIYNEDQNNQ